MSLTALPAEHLQVHDSLPFDVLAGDGRLLLPKGTLIADERQLQQLTVAGAQAEDDESFRAWHARMRERAAAADARTATDFMPEPDAAGEPSPFEAARELPARLAPLLEPGAQTLEHWPQRVEALARQVQAATANAPDALLYLLVQRATRYHEHYSCEHALLCAVVCTLCTEPLRCEPREAHALLCAALTMNLSMTALQDELAQRERTPTLAQRQAIDNHAADSVRLMRQAGVADPLWLGVVAQHHRNADPERTFDELPPEARLASLLHRVDVFTAKISARRSRAGLPAPLAARDACLGPNGLPDTVGAAAIKALSIYPPGSYVRLANSEVGVVVRRGARADQPKVVSLLAPNGRPLPSPQARDTAQARLEIRAAVKANEVRVAVNHQQVLALM